MFVIRVVYCFQTLVLTSNRGLIEIMTNTEGLFVFS